MAARRPPADAIRWEARTIKDHLVIGDIAGIAKSLRDGWEAKKKLATQISNPVIERLTMSPLSTE